MKGKIVFGETRQSDTELIKKFDIKKFPKLIILTRPDQYSGVFYEGAFKKD